MSTYSSNNLPITPLLTRTVTAISDITENHAVGFDGAEATVSGSAVLGFATFSCSSGQSVGVVIAGTAQARVVTGQTIALGDPVTVSSDGRVTKARSTDYIMGRYLGSSSVNQTDRRIEVLITREGAES